MITYRGGVPGDNFRHSKEQGLRVIGADKRLEILATPLGRHLWHAPYHVPCHAPAMTNGATGTLKLRVH